MNIYFAGTILATFFVPLIFMYSESFALAHGKKPKTTGIATIFFLTLLISCLYQTYLWAIV